MKNLNPGDRCVIVGAFTQFENVGKTCTLLHPVNEGDIVEIPMPGGLVVSGPFHNTLAAPGEQFWMVEGPDLYVVCRHEEGPLSFTESIKSGIAIVLDRFLVKIGDNPDVKKLDLKLDTPLYTGRPLTVE